MFNVIKGCTGFKRMPHIIILETPNRIPLTPPYAEGRRALSEVHKEKMQRHSSQLKENTLPFHLPKSEPCVQALSQEAWLQFPSLETSFTASPFFQYSLPYSSSRSPGYIRGRRNPGHWWSVGRRKCPLLVYSLTWGHLLYPWGTILSLWKLHLMR